ncbi:hypothetical protein HanIR_Chr07g0312251 [Helianthus annuus]|uniref:Uncharacterized protein n=1 Tax=Helianthus annuus TaxID=4232 RepID=A0A251T7R9_HELAN|nr:hypothetical protein HanIR_Chr07g0312251 [Helianthus annuus]
MLPRRITLHVSYFLVLRVFSSYVVPLIRFFIYINISTLLLRSTNSAFDFITTVVMKP